MTEDFGKFLEEKTFTVLWHAAIVLHGRNEMLGVALPQLVDVCLVDRDGPRCRGTHEAVILCERIVPLSTSMMMETSQSVFQSAKA